METQKEMNDNRQQMPSDIETEKRPADMLDDRVTDGQVSDERAPHGQVPPETTTSTPEERPVDKTKRKPVKGQGKVDAFATMGLSKLLLKFAIPAVIGLLCNGVQNIVNRIFVGKAVGSVALAAVQIGFPIMAIFMALSMLIGMGSMTLIAIRLGQGRKDDAEKILGMVTLLSFLVPIVAVAICMPFLNPLLIMLGSSAEVLPYARDYFSLFMIGMVFFCPSATINNIIRSQGAPNIAMATQILASALNVFFNYLFVMVFGWGVQGAALGIVLGNFFSLFWVFGFFKTKNCYLRIHMRYLRIYPALLGKICALGISPFLIQLANSAQQLILNRDLSALGGDTALAAVSIVMSLSTILTLPIIGLNQGAQPIISFNYGAGSFPRIKGTLWRAALYATIFAIASFILIQTSAPALVSIFTNDEPAVNELAERALKIFFSCLPLVGIQMVGTGLFQALGKAVHAAFLSLARQVLFFIPCLLILPHFFGLDGCWAAAPVADVLTTVITIIFVLRSLRATEKEMAEKDYSSLVR